MPHHRTAQTKELKRNRLIDAAMAVLWATPDHTLNITVLNKALFYLDLVWLRDHGQTLTGQTYVAYKQGPVVERYEESLVKALESTGLAKQKTDGMAKPVVAIKPASTKAFPAEDDAVRVARFFSKMSSKEASEYSHKNPGWKVAFNPGRVCPIDMEIALQQICEDDPWLEESADEHIKEAFRNATRDAVDF